MCTSAQLHHTTKPIHHQTTQSRNHPLNQLHTHTPRDHPTSNPDTQPTSQPANKPGRQPATQPTAQTPNQSTNYNDAACKHPTQCVAFEAQDYYKILLARRFLFLNLDASHLKSCPIHNTERNTRTPAKYDSTKISYVNYKGRKKCQKAIKTYQNTAGTLNDTTSLGAIRFRPTTCTRLYN